MMIGVLGEKLNVSTQFDDGRLLQYNKEIE